MSSSIIEVALPVPMRQTFDYLIPEHLIANASENLHQGMRVQVSFGRRQLIGIAIQLKSSSTWDRNKLKSIEAILDTTPSIDAEQFRLLEWASRYYHHPIGEVFHAAIPAKLRKGEMNKRPSIRYWRPTELGQQTDLAELKRAPKQQQLLATLHGQAKPEAVLREQFATALFTALEKKHLIESYEFVPPPNFEWHSELTVDNKPFASKEQAVVISALRQQLGQFQVSLLEGVTGSGKTEVYLQAIETILEAGKQVLVLVPEIGLTPQTVERFAARFNISVGVLHSGMTDNERLIVWQQAQAGELGIVIGTRSAVFTPFKALAMIIIDEEHDSSYKQGDGFRYHARDLAVMRAKLSNIPLLLGSATPALESLHNALQKKYQHLQLHQRAGSAVKPTFNTLDIRQQHLQYGFAPDTIRQMNHHLRQGNQVLVFLNRRGYAPALLCHNCGHVEMCNQCERPFTLHKNTHILHCHHCGNTKTIPSHCSQCHQQDMAPEGMGTEQLEQGLQHLFPQYSTIRIDSDTMRAKSRLNQILEDIHSGKHQILIGTQILAKGHHFPKVTFVVVVDIDGALFSANYRSSEQLAQLITQITGRAGRAQQPGEMWLQSHHPGHPLIEDLLHNGYGHFARQLLIERRHANLPPYSYQVLIRAEATKAEAAFNFLHNVAMGVRQTQSSDSNNSNNNSSAASQVNTIGPLPALLEKRQGRYRFQLVLQSMARSPLHTLLHQQLQIITTMPESKKVRWSVDIDPQEFY